MHEFQASAFHPAMNGELSFGNRTKGAQTIIIPGVDSGLIAESALGEKAQKLLALYRQGFRIPKFFVVATDGSGDLNITPDLNRHFEGLQKPVIARSCHPAEGSRHSFSGVLASFPDIRELEGAANRAPGADDDIGFEPPSGLREAYKEIVALADYPMARRYLEQHQITDFRPQDMNLLVMEQLDIKVFGMFITASQGDPNKIEIHYEVRGAEHWARVRTRSFSQDSRGGVIVYDRNADTLPTTTSIDPIRESLTEFGRTAARINDLFGSQQVELAATEGGVYVLQARNIKISDPNDVPRFSGYQTMERDLHAIGYGYYTLPIIVVDRPENSWKDPQVRDALKRRLLEEKERFKEYILVIKDPWDVVMGNTRNPLGSWKDYSFLNALSRDAKVVIRGRQQNAIRHEDWEHVEKGGITVLPPEVTSMMEMFSLDRTADFGALTSGDRLSVLSNVDGVFVWNPAVR